MVWTDFPRLLSTTTRPGTWDPWPDAGRLHDELSRLLGGLASPSARRRKPPVRVFSDERGAHVTALLPGLSTEDVEVQVEGDSLSISGRRPAPDLEDGESWIFRERRTGEFRRALTFPFAIDAERVEARMKDGVLEVDLPRSPEELPRKIEVNAG